ncbi:hypothetical protein WA158_002437 [Blastocystis sp. Blastoise]
MSSIQKVNSKPSSVSLIEELNSESSDDEVVTIDNVSEKKETFVTDLKKMMYGCGDSIVPLSETLDVMNEYVTDFIVELTKKSLETARDNKIPMDCGCIQFSVRKMPAYVQRAKELLESYSKIMEATHFVVSEDQYAMEDRPKGQTKRKPKEMNDALSATPKRQKRKSFDEESVTTTQ